jgi:hypothetical protein
MQAQREGLSELSTGVSEAASFVRGSLREREHDPSDEFSELELKLEMPYPNVSYSLVEPRSRVAAWAAPSYCVPADWVRLMLLVAQYVSFFMLFDLFTSTCSDARGSSPLGHFLIGPELPAAAHG